VTRNHRLEDGLAVLRLAARGMSNPQIGTVLHISSESVKGRLHRLYALLGAVNVAHAVVIAGMERLLSPEDLRAAAATRRPGWVEDGSALRRLQKEA
jgi:DNA-binding CsgD family transcriptional regulator